MVPYLKAAKVAEALRLSYSDQPWWVKARLHQDPVLGYYAEIVTRGGIDTSRLPTELGGVAIRTDEERTSDE
jgi:hypothetical protein